MKIALVGFGLLLPTLPLAAEITAESKPSAAAATEKTPAQAAIPEKWGKAVDPDQDCKFRGDEKSLSITVPGSAQPHDLSAELGSMNAPRVLKPVKGDFTMQVTVQGMFAPGDDSTQPGRTGYTGAGILLIADANNFVRLERATLHGAGGIPQDYVNFEMRQDGKLLRIGTTGDRPITSQNPLHLRLERKGKQLHGYVSEDGENWDAMNPKELPDSWSDRAEIGVAAISTSRFPFEPTFTAMNLVSEPIITVPEPGTVAPDSTPAAPAPSAKEADQ